MNSEIDKYTITVFTLKDNNFDFGLNDYPIWKEEYRPILNNAILEYYMFREIGYVNPAVWRQRLRNRMDIIMRNKYNALYSAKAKEFNPLYTMELYEDYTHTITNTGQNTTNGEINVTSNSTSTQHTKNDSENTTETTSDNLGLSSQFPSEEMTENDLTSNLFVDNANKSKGTENTTDNVEQTTDTNATNNGTDITTNSNKGTSINSTSESYNKKTYGSASDLSFAHAMTQFKDYCDQFELDKQVIDGLKDLFIQIW